ncbi:MAG: hypothetical protein AABY22_03645 [Nanoarchaeota archaeon]
MINFMVSRYNQDVSWVAKYAPSMILYDRSDDPIPGSIIIPNIGTDIADKFHYIITNYNNLPPVSVYTKANLFKYISQPEFDRVKNNSWFTPLLTMNHKETKYDGTEEYVKRHGTDKDVSFYKDGIYWELNNGWYLNEHPCKHDPKEVAKAVGIDSLEYVPFAPGSNYILTAEDIRRHPIEFYHKLYNYLNWSVYPGEAQIIERGLYTIFR